MIEVISIILITSGLIFFAGTVIGVLRFPDFFTRVHAAGKGDTLSSLLIIIGLALYNLHHLSFAALLVSLKIALISAFLFISGPTTTHALMEAGYDSGVKPWTRKRKPKKAEPEP